MPNKTNPVAMMGYIEVEVLEHDLLLLCGIGVGDELRRKGIEGFSVLISLNVYLFIRYTETLKEFEDDIFRHQLAAKSTFLVRYELEALYSVSFVGLYLFHQRLDLVFCWFPSCDVDKKDLFILVDTSFLCCLHPL